MMILTALIMPAIFTTIIVTAKPWDVTKKKVETSTANTESAKVIYLKALKIGLAA